MPEARQMDTEHLTNPIFSTKVDEACLQNVLATILTVMGLNASEVNDSESLSRLGIDSMQLVEVSPLLHISSHFILLDCKFPPAFYKHIHLKLCDTFGRSFRPLSACKMAETPEIFIGVPCCV